MSLLRRHSVISKNTSQLYYHFVETQPWAVPSMPDGWTLWGGPQDASNYIAEHANGVEIVKDTVTVGIRIDGIVEVGKAYTIRVDVVSLSGALGTFRIFDGGAYSSNIATTGVYEHTGTTAAVNRVLIVPDSASTVVIRFIEIIEI